MVFVRMYKNIKMKQDFKRLNNSNKFWIENYSVYNPLLYFNKYTTPITLHLSICNETRIIVVLKLTKQDEDIEESGYEVSKSNAKNKKRSRERSRRDIRILG